MNDLRVRSDMSSRYIKIILNDFKIRMKSNQFLIILVENNGDIAGEY